MEQFNLRQDTIVHHLYTYAQEGHPLIESNAFFDLSTLPPKLKEAVLSRFEALGCYRLKPVFDACDGAVDYRELKILRLHHVIQNGVS